jgi:hypothetical protein
MTSIRLFTSVFPEPREWRRLEFAECLSRNLACADIDEIVVFVEGNVDLPRHHRLTAIAVTSRPTYADYLARMAGFATDDDISIIANSDIYFDASIGLLRDFPPAHDAVLALARWESAGSGTPYLNDRNDSQDAWIFRGQPRAMGADFPVGVPRCDNRFAKELENAGYSVLNPAFSIRAYHLHDELRGEYPNELRDDFVPGPYGYVWPHNLVSLPRIAASRLQNPSRRIGWRFDRRYWHRRLKLHWIDKALRVLGLRPTP